MTAKSKLLPKKLVVPGLAIRQPFYHFFLFAHTPRQCEKALKNSVNSCIIGYIYHRKGINGIGYHRSTDSLLQ